MKILAALGGLAAVAIGFIVLTCEIEVSIHPPNQILLEINPDPGAVRPRSFCIGNPLRNRQPERIAISYLKQLRNQNIAPVIEYVRPDYRDHIAKREAEYPILSWRLGARRDDERKTSITYWVNRGNGYPCEEEVHFWFDRIGGEWRLKQYSAIY